MVCHLEDILPSILSLSRLNLQAADVVLKHKLVLPDGLKLPAIFHPFHFELRGACDLTVQTDWISNCYLYHLRFLCDLRRLYNTKQSQAFINLLTESEKWKDLITMTREAEVYLAP